MLMVTLRTCLPTSSGCNPQSRLRRLEHGRLCSAGLCVQQLVLLVGRTFILICNAKSRNLEGG